MKREPPVREHRWPSNPTTDTGSGRADGDYNISIGFWQPSGAPAHVQRGRLFCRHAPGRCRFKVHLAEFCKPTD
jgi:hypothetical protein